MTMATPYTFVTSPGTASSYSFKTYQGKAVGVRIGTKLNLSGSNLVLEFDRNSKFPAPMSIGAVTFTDGAIHIAMSAEEVDQLKGGVYRVRSVSPTHNYTLLAGIVDYEVAEVESDLLDENGVLRIELLPLEQIFDALDDMFLPRSEYAGSGGYDAGTIQGMINTSLLLHTQEATPHRAYDEDMESLTLLFENRLV